jgi:hypothetical protein
MQLALPPDARKKILKLRIFCNRDLPSDVQQVKGVCTGVMQMAEQKIRDPWKAFRDFFILFSGISTASNLARTQGRKLLTRGVFIFRPRPDKQAQ